MGNATPSCSDHQAVWVPPEHQGPGALDGPVDEWSRKLGQSKGPGGMGVAQRQIGTGVCSAGVHRGSCLFPPRTCGRLH